MYFSKRPGDRASDIQRSTVAAWYAGICFVICVAGAIWLASLFGVIDFNSGTTDPATYKSAAREAAQRAAAQQVQARQAAREEARDIAADAHRSILSPMPTPQAEPAESAAGGASISQPPAPVATNQAPQKPASRDGDNN